MKKRLIRVFIIVVLGVGAYLLLTSGLFTPKSEEGSIAVSTYTNEKYGILFTYPKEYILAEAERGNAERSHYSIVMTSPGDTIAPENGEGPTAITIDIYQNNLDKETLLGWLQGNGASNFKLGDGKYSATVVGGTEALQYRWSGLYEGETTAFLHKENVVAVSVTYLDSGDEKTGVYRDIVSTMVLTK